MQVTNTTKKNLILCLVLGFVLIITLWMNLFSSKNSREVSLPVAVDKVIKYRFEVSNPSNSFIDKASLFVAIPAEISRQKITSLSVATPFKKIAHDIGNRSLNIELSAIAPYQTKTVDITLKMGLDSTWAEAPLDEVGMYTKPEKFIESNDDRILRKARFIKGETQLEQSKKAYDWVVSYLSDSGYVEEDRGALQALESGFADCTGYMYLYGALLRAKGIPARMMSGFIVENNKKLQVKDYHNWVEVYLDGTWRVVDPQNKKFLEDENNYIAMRVISGSKLGSFDNLQQLFNTDAELEVKML